MRCLRLGLVALLLSTPIGCGNPGAPTMPPVDGTTTTPGAASPKSAPDPKKPLTAEKPGPAQ